VGDSPWLFASGMAEAGSAGHLRLINTSDRSWSVIYPAGNSVAALDARRFPNCPAAPDATKFSAHGIFLRALGGGRHELLVVNHGGREAVEYFEVSTSGGRPAVQWIGCVPMAADIYLNSVVGLRDGGFIATHFYSPSKGGINSVFAREITGGIHEWHPGRAVTLIPGTELSGANGLAVSPDERVIHVAAWGTRDLVRFERQGNSVTKRVVPMTFAPDNVRWSQDGRSLLVAGQKFVARAGGPASLDGWSVVRVNPDTLAITVIRDADGTGPMQGITVGVEVADEIWVGTFRGDRVGYFPRSR